jgi:hypothetical protein
MIFKVQRPLDQPEGQWMAYSEGWAARLYFIPFASMPEHLREAMGRDYKGYFEGSVEGTVLTLNARVADQDW